jgi:hypothetical protein
MGPAVEQEAGVSRKWGALLKGKHGTQKWRAFHEILLFFAMYVVFVPVRCGGMKPEKKHPFGGNTDLPCFCPHSCTCTERITCTLVLDAGFFLTPTLP